ALLLPFVTAWVSRSITQLMLATAVLSAVSAVAYGILKFPEAREASGASMLESFKALRYPGVLVFGVLLFFESGNEAAITGWMTTWAGSMGASVRNATLLLALFQGMMMLGRIVAAPILKVVSNSQMVAGSAISAVIAAILLVSAHSLTMLTIGAAALGLAFAPIYPTVLALAGDRYQRYAGTVFGILFTIGLAGGIAYPWGIGHASQSGGIRAGMWFPVVGAVAIAGLVAVLRAKYPAREQASRA
ncbi:MAG: MFS transporter, partial [Terriglobales bacterium]